MKNLFMTLVILLSLNVSADTYLQSGESQWINSGTVHCGVSQPTEKSYTCTYKVCLKSSSIHHVSVHNCNFFNGYESSSSSVWAYSGSEAEAKVAQEISSDPDTLDYKSRNISCV